MSIGVKTWGSVIFRYPKNQFRPLQIEEALQGLSESLQPEKPIRVNLSLKNGLNTVTILENSKNKALTSQPIVFQQGNTQSSPASLLKTALKQIQAMRSVPSSNMPLPNSGVKALPKQDSFHQTHSGNKVHYFDPIHPPD